MEKMKKRHLIRSNLIEYGSFNLFIILLFIMSPVFNSGKEDIVNILFFFIRVC